MEKDRRPGPLFQLLKKIPSEPDFPCSNHGVVRSRARRAWCKAPLGHFPLQSATWQLFSTTLVLFAAGRRAQEDLAPLLAALSSGPLDACARCMRVCHGSPALVAPVIVGRHCSLSSSASRCASQPGRDCDFTCHSLEAAPISVPARRGSFHQTERVERPLNTFLGIHSHRRADVNHHSSQSRASRSLRVMRESASRILHDFFVLRATASGRGDGAISVDRVDHCEPCACHCPQAHLRKSSS